MTQENKELLIKDLCARLPYGVWHEHKLKSCEFGTKGMLNDANEIDFIRKGRYDFYKPYLFPLSSMTEEQKSQYSFFLTRIIDGYDLSLLIDWLNKNHFDYRGLIEKSLALDATNLGIYE